MFEKSIINYALAAIISVTAVDTAVTAGWEYYYRKGTLQFEGGRYQSAMENLDRALDINPSLYDASNKIALILITWNKKRQALDYLDRSLAIKPDQADINVTAGEIRDFFGYHERAFEHYSNAVRIDPSNVNAHFRLVRYYVERKDTANADRHFAAAYAIGREDGERLLAEAIEEERKNNTAGAVALYKRAIEKNPAFLEAYFHLAELHRRVGRPDEAIPVLEEVKKIRPDNEKAHVYLGHLYYARRHGSRRKYILTQAVRNFERALQINPSNTDTLLGLSEVYRHMGDRDRADELRERALSLENERNREARERP